MLKIFRYTVLISMLTLLFVSGCSDRGTNIPVKPDTDFIRSLQDVKIAPLVHDFYPELSFQIRNQFRLLEMAVYVPDIAFPEPYGTEESVPLLVLLPPQDGDQYYYFNHGLQQLADDLIADGTIEPMIICCITNDKAFGGYFYASSNPAGDYDEIIGNKLIGYMEQSFPVIESPAKRGIGGVGMGAYGAFRSTILNPNIYSAISATDGPLDFDGADGSSGLMDLFDDALTEQGLDETTFKNFDTTGAWHVSRLFVGGALAFSPHDTLIYSHDVLITQMVNGVIVSQNLQLNIDSTLTYDDETTLIADVVSGVRDLDFHLPFSGTGEVYGPIWQLWLDNNLETLIADKGPSALAGVEIQIRTTPEARFGFYNQTQSWVNTIMNPPYSYKIDYERYTGFDGNPATNDQYLYEVMKDMLIFHSNNFGK